MRRVTGLAVSGHSSGVRQSWISVGLLTTSYE